MSSQIVKFLEADDLGQETQNLVKKYFGFSALSRTLLLISSTFYILYILELVNFTQAGILVSIGFIAQAIIDYPTGVLADWLGHKFVLFASYIAHAISFMLLALNSLIPSTWLFEYLIVVYLVEAFALAQESGALQSWFDNNYKITIGRNDPNKTTYRAIYGKTLMILRFIGGLGIFIGGAVSDGLSRELVFGTQSIFMIILAFSFLILLNDNQQKERPEISVAGYLSMLRDGVKLIFKNPMLRYFIIGFVILITVGSIWVALIIFPIYFGYTGSDSLSGLLRSLLFISGAAITGFGATLSKKLQVKTWLPRIFLIHGFFFYGIYALIVFIFPLPYGTNAEFNGIAILLLFIAGSVGNLTSTLGLLLIQRFMVDAVPDENRNSFYSLGPTLGLLLSSITVVIVGNFIDTTGNLTLTIIIFIMIPMLLAAISILKAMSYYDPKEVIKSTHPHPMISPDMSLTDLSHIFILSLPNVFDDDTEVKEVWTDFVNMVSKHLKTLDHEFFDIILDDISNYSNKYLEIKNKGEMTTENHKELTTLRSTLIDNAHLLRDKQQLNNEEDKLLHVLVELLHEKEHLELI